MAQVLRRMVLAVSLALAAAGCRSSESGAASARLGPVTFTRDVAPILFKHCASCHRPGQSAPFSLLSYGDVRRRAHTIVDVTARRYMPPWLPVKGYGEFAGERRLSADEIETIRQWDEQGAVEGSPADLPPPPSFVDGWQLGEPDLVVTLSEPFTLRADGPDVWRNFVVPIPVSGTRYVRTVELHPGSARFVHHALLAVDPTPASRRRDAEDPEPGFAGMDMGDAAAPDGHLLGWTPGMQPFPGTPGHAWRVDEGTDLVLQLHMLPSGRTETVQPAVGFYFAPEPPPGPSMYLMRLDADWALDIPAGARSFEVRDTFQLPVDVDVYAVYPHAHFIATAIEGTARLPGGAEQPLIRIDNWDFKWQDVYRYRQPLRLPQGTILDMRIRYDNSAENSRNPSDPPRRVVAGPRSTDEMAHLQLQVLPRTAADAVLLKAAYYRHILEHYPGDAWAYYELANAMRDAGRLSEAVELYRQAIHANPSHAAARNNLGALLVEDGRVDEAAQQYRQAIQAEPDFADAHYNLGNALRLQGALADAVHEYREAVRLEPGMGEAHTNLGEVLATLGDMNAAIDQFRRAIQINPASAQAHNNLGAGLASQGRMAEAVAEFREALRLDPEHAGARANLELALERTR